MKATLLRVCGLLYFHWRPSVTKQQEGDIDHWNEKGFGFIRQPGGGRIFFSLHYVLPDWKGSKAWCFGRGIPVKFGITQRILGGETKTCAADVEPIFEMSEPENINGYRETSEVLNLNRQKGFGFLHRPCGDSIFFHRKDIVPEFENRWYFLEVGSPVWHGVKFNGSTGLWRAVDIELYGYEELQKFKNEDLQAPTYEEPESEPEPQPAPLVVAPVEHKSQLLRVENKNKSILELILRRSLVTPSRRRSS
jgi:cold shock CspA family protein